MKKALSFLLAAMLLLGVAAPMAFAADISITADKTELTVGNPFDAAAATATLSHTHACVADCLIYWDVDGNVFPVTFRPENYDDALPRPDNTTKGDDTMAVEALATLTESTTVKITMECQDCGDTGSIELTITVEPPEDIPDDDFLSILRIWWHDLKWTWNYEIHPFFKYVYFSTCGWITSAWNMLVEAIKGLFA